MAGTVDFFSSSPEVGQATRDTRELEAVRAFFAALLLARKNCSLYPKGHMVSRTSLEHCHALIEGYTRVHGSLRVEVGKDRLMSKGDVVLEDGQGDLSLPFVLFRDGIRWIEFREGIGLGELEDFVETVNRYSLLTDESDGDIVTELWERKLEHIGYEVTEAFWAEETCLEDHAESVEFDHEGHSEHAMQVIAAEEPDDPVVDVSSLGLTRQEEDIHREMVRLEEEGDHTAYLDALFDSLLQLRSMENYDLIFEVLKEEFSLSIAGADLDLACKILQRIRYVRDTCGIDEPWVASAADEFVREVSHERVLAGLVGVWTSLSDSQVERARDILEMLHPDALPALCTLLVLPQAASHRKVAEDVIAALACRDPGILERVMASSDPKVTERLVPVLARMDRDVAGGFLLKLLRHPFGKVRLEVVRQVVRMGLHAKEIFRLIDDEDENVSRMVVGVLGASRSREAERLLMEYLKRRTFGRTEDAHGLSCYEALGKCGSSECISFLRGRLMEKPWMPPFWKRTERLGAALALARLGSAESRKVLEKASRSLWPSLRYIVRKAMEAKR
ncbi:MAG TPA: HEAT repeat domain-containing protein [Deltaproteobacteria bacterium]|nr:HEAT repeat domain-containing protein [Deltaproteobacteria bacterium]HPP80835.1 HEAT repeat domain-containing protein [Deltaproteobacteria bacterium]